MFHGNEQADINSIYNIVDELNVWISKFNGELTNIVMSLTGYVLSLEVNIYSAG